MKMLNVRGGDRPEGDGRVGEAGGRRVQAAVEPANHEQHVRRDLQQT